MTWPRDLPMIDAHHHLWAVDGAIRYPVLDGTGGAFFLGDIKRLRTDHLPSQYRRATAGVPITQTIAIEAECAPGQKVEEARWLAGLEARHGMPSAVVAGADFGSAQLGQTLAELSRIPAVRTVRCKPRTRASAMERLTTTEGSLADERWRSGFRSLQAYGLGWDLRVPYWHLSEAAELVAQSPAIPVVVEHAGLPLARTSAALIEWRAGMRRLAALSNTWCKLSCLVQPGAAWDASSNEKIVRETIEIFGQDRCMFATNYPIDELQIPVRPMLDAYRGFTDSLGIDAQRKLFHDNAATVYGLPARA